MRGIIDRANTAQVARPQALTGRAPKQQQHYTKQQQLPLDLRQGLVELLRFQLLRFQLKDTGAQRPRCTCRSTA